jgi:hypothetical protein
LNFTSGERALDRTDVILISGSNQNFPAAIDVLDIASPHSVQIGTLPEQESGLIIAQTG